MGGAVSSGSTNNELIDNLVSANYIRSRNVERVFRALDRADYMTMEARDQAYKDLAWRNGPLHLSSPCIYSEVMEGLELKPGLSFLNIGSGTGYLSTLAGLILGTAGISHGVEVHPAVLEYALEKIKVFLDRSLVLEEIDFCEPNFYLGNGLCLSQPLTGYDRVYCGAGCPGEYENYLKRLIKVGGILVMPLNDKLVQVRRVGENKWTSRSLLNVSFATLRVPNAEDASNPVKLDVQTPVRLQLLARAAIRAGLWRGVTRRAPMLGERKPRSPAAAPCPHRICLPLEPGGSVEGLNLLDGLDSENGANEMNALLSLVISMDRSRVAGALRFDRLSPSDSEHDDDQQDPAEQPEPAEQPDRPNSDHRDNRNQDNDPRGHNQDNNHQDDPNRDLADPLTEQLATETVRGPRLVGIIEPIVLPRYESTYDMMVYSDSDSLPDSFEPTRNDDSRSRYTYNKSNSSGISRPTEPVDSHTAGSKPDKINSTPDNSKPVDSSENTDFSRSVDTNNTTIDTDASRLSADTANDTSHHMSPVLPCYTSLPNATSDDPGDNDRRPRANSTDENKLSNSLKSGRTRHLYGKSRPSTSCGKSGSSTDTKNAADTTPGEATDAIISQDPKSVPPRPDLPGMPSEIKIDLGKMAQTEAITSPSEMVWEETRPDSLEGSEDETDTTKSKPKRQKLDSGIGENTPSGSSPDKSKNSESDGCLQCDCPTSEPEDTFHDIASDEDRFDTYDSHSNSESVIESDSPSEDSEELTGDMASDEDRFDIYDIDNHSNSESVIESDSPSEDSEELTGGFIINEDIIHGILNSESNRSSSDAISVTTLDMASDEDRFDTYDSHSNSESVIESDSPSEDSEELTGGRTLPQSYWALTAELAPPRGRRRVVIGRGCDRRLMRVSCLMREGLRELPLPHPLKSFVNFGRRYEGP